MVRLVVACVAGVALATPTVLAASCPNLAMSETPYSKLSSEKVSSLCEECFDLIDKVRTHNFSFLISLVFLAAPPTLSHKPVPVSLVLHFLAAQSTCGDAKFCPMVTGKTWCGAASSLSCDTLDGFDVENEYPGVTGSMGRKCCQKYATGNTDSSCGGLPPRAGSNSSSMNVTAHPSSESAFFSVFGDIPPLWFWWGCLVAVSILNIILLGVAMVKIDPKDSYGKLMKVLAIPWVLECAWRSVFPSLYLQRFVFWDTWLNSVIVDRTWACAGELAWVYQTALALRHVDTQITGGKKWIQASAWVAFAIYIAAECTSYYNVATTNEYFAALEVVLDGVSYLVMLPASVYLWFNCPGKVCSNSAKIYLTAMPIVCLFYPIYNCFVDAPMYMARYRSDQAHHKSYFTFVAGLEDAATRRVVTHNLSDWKQDMTWMAVYFSAGAWSGLLLMFAPRVPAKSTLRAASMLRVSPEANVALLGSHVNQV